MPGLGMKPRCLGGLLARVVRALVESNAGGGVDRVDERGALMSARGASGRERRRAEQAGDHEEPTHAPTLEAGPPVVNTHAGRSRPERGTSAS
jgi:hypothetical protein